MKHFILFVALIALAACGVQRPLIPPKNVPEYEEAQRKKREALIEEQRELEALDQKRAAEQKPAE